jgi:hypothetical protein
MFDVNDPAQKEFVDRFLAAIKNYSDSSHRDLSARVDVLVSLLAELEQRFVELKGEISELKK